MDSEMVSRFKRIAAADVADELEELGIDGVVTGLQQAYPGAMMCGPAVTVRHVKAKAKGLKLNRIHEVLEDVAKPGDVLIIVPDGDDAWASWGGTMSWRAKGRNLEGAICAGTIRDKDEIIKARFPVYYRRASPRTGSAYLETVGVNQPVQVEGKVVRAGDIIFADGDGITIIPAEKAEEILQRAEQRWAKVEALRAMARTGKSPFAGPGRAAHPDPGDRS